MKAGNKLTEKMQTAEESNKENSYFCTIKSLVRNLTQLKAVDYIRKSQDTQNKELGPSF